MILTQYEIDSQWSSTVYGNTILETIAAETSATLVSIGKSFEDRDILQLTIGNGDRTLFITSGVHRSEPASREVVLMKARDMAYNLDSKYTEYLNNHKVIFIPTVSPDVLTRLNAQGLNINRDSYSLQTPEMQHLMRVMTDALPEVYVDFHERGGDLMQIEFVNPMILDPNASRKVREASVKMVSSIRNELEGKDYVTAPYPEWSIGPSMATSMQGLLGSLTVTPETHINIVDTQYRIDAQSDVFEEILKWHTLNESLVDETRLSFQENQIKPKDEFILLNNNNEYYNYATKEPIVVPEGYLLKNPSDFSLWQEVYNIEVNEDGFVPIKQHAGRLLPHLLDPQSDLAVVPATRVEPIDTKRTDGRYTLALYDEWREIFIQFFHSRTS